MNFPKELKYTKTHEWAQRNGKTIRVGITDYAQKEISDVVFIELPKMNQSAQIAKPVAVVESVIAAFDIYAPLSGKVTKVNPDLESDPGRVNHECYGAGWFFEMDIANEAEWNTLLSAQDYEKFVSAAAH